MTTDQLDTARYHAGALKGAAQKEKATYKRQLLFDAANFLESLKGWQPIKTAPKDGTFILAAAPSGYIGTPLRVSVCTWEDGGRFGPRSAGWRTHSGDWFTEGGADAISWMPLPAIDQEES